MSTTLSRNPSQIDRATRDAMPADTVSVWLYIAGWLVSLSGLFAVNFSLNNPGFATLTYSLTTGGYVISYVLRTRNLSLRAVQTPLLVGISLVTLAAISSGQGIAWLVPVEDPEDRSKSLQLLFAWFVVLHSFTLSADANVLFVCVPCMTMIALASTQGTEAELLYAFVVFVGAATFLMVHENYLRTRQGRVLGRTQDTERRLFGGQVQLAAFCVISALLLANFVAVPIRQVGMSLSLAGGLSTLNNAAAQQRMQQAARASVVELNELELARGPEALSSTLVMKVITPRGLYLRGSSFDFYTGRSFRNLLAQEQPLTPREIGVSDEARYQQYVDIREPGRPGRREFLLPPGFADIPPEQMEGSDQVTQVVRPAGGRMMNLYGAATPIRILGAFRNLVVSAAGSMRSLDIPAGNLDEYVVVSQVPSEDPAILRVAATRPIPEFIQRFYLQVANPITGTENPRLRQLAQEITRGLLNPYDRVIAIERYLETNCKYNLQAARAPRDRDIVEYFLTESRQGYCDSFAAAMTMLCRYAGVPARIASGFLPGEFNEQENAYAIRQKDKHVWTEVFFPGVGWVGFDATDGAEDISAQDRDGRTRRVGFLAWLRSQGGPGIAILAVCIALLAIVLKTEFWDRWIAARAKKTAQQTVRPATSLQILNAYTQACQLLQRCGLTRPAHLTPLEYAREIALRNNATLPEAMASFENLTALFTRYRYSAEAASDHEVNEALQALETLQTQLRQVKRARIVPITEPVPV